MNKYHLEVEPRSNGWYYVEVWSGPGLNPTESQLTRKASTCCETRTKAINRALRLADKHIKENEQ